MSTLLNWKKKALLMGSAGWWLPSGMVESDCFAAFQFKGAASEADALIDKTGHGYNLAKSSSDITWNKDTGFSWVNNLSGQSTLNNSNLSNQTVKSAVIRYADAGSNVWFTAVNGSRFNMCRNYFRYDYDGALWGLLGGFNWWDEGSSRGRNCLKGITAPNPDSGVFGYNQAWGDQRSSSVSNPGEYYIDGVKYAANQGNNGFDNAPDNCGGIFGGAAAGNGVNYSGFKIVAGVFYNRWLTAEEHAFVAGQLLAL